MKETTKKIVVVDTAASNGGAMTVLKDFYEAVKKGNSNTEWYFLLNDAYLQETENIKILVIPNVKKYAQRIYFDYVRGAQIINKIDPDLVFSLQNTMVHGLHCRQVLYVHQPVPFQNVYHFSLFRQGEFKMALIQNYLGAMIRNSIRKTDKTIVQTKWIKDSIVEITGVPGDKVVQIYPTAREVVNRAEYETTNHFFFPTSKEFYKNTSLVEKACQELDKENIEYSCQITITGESLSSNLYKSGPIPLEEVYKKYETSCLVFASYIESFGYPLIEAASVGSIVLASDCPFSHELLKDYENVYFFNPFSVDELVTLMKKVANGEIKRKDAVLVNRLKTDSWNDVIEELYHQL